MYGYISYFYINSVCTHYLFTDPFVAVRYNRTILYGGGFCVLKSNKKKPSKNLQIDAAACTK